MFGYLRHLYVRKIIAIGFLLFIALWIVGIVRGMTLPYPPPLPVPISIPHGSEREYFAANSVSNFANNLKQIGLVETPLPLVLENPNVDKIRIFEKKAILATASPTFDKDETAVRTAIAAYQASIFNEKNAGIEPERKLMIEIGVNPDKFDGLVDQLRKVGSLASISIEQKDRTSEFRKLFAQRQSLKKNLDAIVKLREGKALSFDESLRLEQKIQDIEKELQSLGVQFGDLLGKESFYHIHLTLVEYQPGDHRDQTYTLTQRVGHAFLWAFGWWFVVVLAVSGLGAIGVSVWVLRQKPAA